MSLVGPRADLVEQAAGYGRGAAAVDVRPGITGWAQVNGRDSVSWTGAVRARPLVPRQLVALARRQDPRRTVGEIFRPEPEPVEDALNIERPKKRASST